MKLGLRADLPGVCGHTALGRWRGECSPGCRVPLLSRWLDGALDSLLIATAGSQPPFGVRGYWAAAASPQSDAGRVVWGRQVASSAMCYSDPLVAPQSGGSGFKGTVL